MKINKALSYQKFYVKKVNYKYKVKNKRHKVDV